MASLSGPADSLNHPDAGDGMMSSVESTPEREARLDGTFGAHLEAVCERSARALTASGYASLLVPSGSLVDVFEDDRTYPFEANAPFKVWVPLQDAAECFVWFEPGAVPRLIIHRAQDYWHKSADLPRAYWTRHFQVRTAIDRAGARAQLPADLSRAAYIGDALPELTSWGIGAINPRQLMRRLDYARAVKTPYELACLREASRLGARGHRAAERAFRAGASELEIELAFLAACGQREQELPYNPIIALNEGGAVLHYQVLEKHPPCERHSLLIDAAAEFAGYPNLRPTGVLEEGFVVTLEPGIYFIEQLPDAARADARGRCINWPRVEALSKFGGIRIEDDLAVTREGCENLTREAFRSLQP